MRCKTLNAGNVLPAVKENDGLSAVINRMVILLFPISISKEQQNLELPEKLYEERDGIFSEAMDALVQLRKNGFCFTESDDSIKLKNQMVEQSRILDVFLQDCCVIQKEGKIYLRTLYEAFEEYCEENLFECKYSKTQFSQFLSQKPELTRKKIRVGSGKPLSGIEGLRLKEAKEYINEESLVNRKPRNNGTKEQKMYYNRQDSEK